MKLNDSNVTIMVNDMDKSINFYESIGLTLKQRWGNNYAMISGAGITLGIHPNDGRKVSSGSVSIGFMIDDFEGAKKLLEKNGIKFNAVDDGKSGNFLNFEDPDGTGLYFMLPKW
jgi:catechol 2,3-dioxygenase-like lactoylglutathione lyase family enzyme